MRRRPRRTSLMVAAALVVSIGAVACRRGPLPVAGRVTVLEGHAEVGRPGEERREISGSRDLRVGDGVRVRDGAAVIRMSGERELELRSGTDLELRSVDAPGRIRPALLNGDLLVRSPLDAFLVTAGRGEVAVRGVARVSRGLGLVVGTYEGAATVDPTTRSFVVPSLRQVTVPAAGLFPARPSPLTYSALDPWDRRYLSSAIGLDDELLARSRGYSAQRSGNELRTVREVAELFPTLAGESGFQPSLLRPGRLPGETLVGAAVTLAGSKGSFVTRWEAVFSFHDDGAPWGLVAQDQGVNRISVLEAIDAAIRRGPTSFAIAQPGPSPTSLSPPTTRTTTGPPPVPSTTVPMSSVPPATVPVTPTTVPPTGPINLGVPPIDNSVNSLVNTLTGLLNTLGHL